MGGLRVIFSATGLDFFNKRGSFAKYDSLESDSKGICSFPM
jgi:hypothetical protein